MSPTSYGIGVSFGTSKPLRRAVKSDAIACSRIYIACLRNSGALVKIVAPKFTNALSAVKSSYLYPLALARSN